MGQSLKFLLLALCACAGAGGQDRAAAGLSQGLLPQGQAVAASHVVAELQVGLRHVGRHATMCHMPQRLLHVSGLDLLCAG